MRVVPVRRPSLAQLTQSRVGSPSGWERLLSRKGVLYLPLTKPSFLLLCGMRGRG